MKYTYDDGTVINWKTILENESKTSDETNDDSHGCCLITYDPLQEPFVKLECGHSFNYLPLYKAIAKSKPVGNTTHPLDLFSQHSKTCRIHEIQCPYCRHVQEKLLPFHDMEGVEKLCGVNWMSEEYLYTNYHNDHCCYKITPHHTCPSKWVIKLQDGNSYCQCHVAKMNRAIQKDLIKQEKIAVKLKKETAKQENMAKKKTPVQNVVISLGCQAILKTGANKGHPCSNPIKVGTMCGRHLHLNA